MLEVLDTKQIVDLVAEREYEFVAEYVGGLACALDLTERLMGAANARSFAGQQPGVVPSFRPVQRSDHE